MKKFRKSMMVASASIFIGMVSGVEQSFAQPAPTTGGANMTTIVDNIGTSIEGVPGLITGVSYMMGIMLGVLGILKIKDHVENPSGAKLQEGAIRLAAGGGLFALPIVYEAMKNTIGEGDGVEVPTVDGITFDTN